MNGGIGKGPGGDDGAQETRSIIGFNIGSCMLFARPFSLYVILNSGREAYGALSPRLTKSPADVPEKANVNPSPIGKIPLSHVLEGSRLYSMFG